MTTNNNLVTSAIKNAQSKAARIAMGTSFRPAMAITGPRFHKRYGMGTTVTVSINDGELPKHSGWKSFLRWIGTIALMLFVSFAVSVWTYVNLDYLSDKTISDGADFGVKLEHYLAKRGLYVNWRGFNLPQVYIVERVPMDPSIGEHYEVIEGEGWIIRPLGGMDSIAIQASSDDQGVYWESEYIVWPQSERGRG